VTTGLAQALLIATPGLPLALAFVHLLAVASPGSRSGTRARLAAAMPWAAAPGALLVVMSLAGGLRPSAGVAVPGGLLGLELGLDATGRAFLLLTSLVWAACGVYAHRAHADDPHRDWLTGFFLLTLAGNAGLVVAADAVSFYTFFVIMTFSAWGLVVHRRDPDALRAGRVYVVLAVLGDVAILAGILALGAAASGNIGFGPELESAWAALGGPAGISGPEIVGALLIGGFGVKAGLVPLHLWVPVSYRAAPPVVTALLSGALAEAAVLAWLRFLPGSTALPGVGSVLIVAGMVAALWGVIAGLPQRQPSTVLAYSTVSQMGFMAMACGVVARGTDAAAIGVVAATFLAVHHGVAKGALFLSTGLAARITHWRGSQWRPAILLGALLPALAISGAPLTSGARAKGTLETALKGLGGGWYDTLGPLLMIGAFGTTVLLARFVVLLDRREEGDGASVPAGDAGEGDGATVPAGMVAPWAALVVVSVVAVAWVPALLSFGGRAAPASDSPIAPLLDAPLHALGPVAAGVLVGWIVLGRPGLLGPLSRIRIPPGDLLAPLSAAFHRVKTAGWPDLASPIRRVAEALASLGRRIADRLDAVSRNDLALARSPALGAGLLALVAAIVAVLTVS